MGGAWKSRMKVIVFMCPVFVDWALKSVTCIYPSLRLYWQYIFFFFFFFFYRTGDGGWGICKSS